MTSIQSLDRFPLNEMFYINQHNSLLACRKVLCTCICLLCVFNRDSFDDLLPLATNNRVDIDELSSQQSAADGEQWTAVNRR